MFPFKAAKCPYGPLYFSVTKFLSSPHHPSQRFSLFPSSLFSVLNPTIHQAYAQYCPTLCNVLDFQPALQSVGCFRQEYCSALPFSPPGGLHNPGIKPKSALSPALQADSLRAELRGKPKSSIHLSVFQLMRVLF